MARTMPAHQRTQDFAWGLLATKDLKI